MHGHQCFLEQNGSLTKSNEKMEDMFNTSINYIEQYVKDPETAVEKLKAEPKVKEAFVENEKADIEKENKNA